MFGILYFHVLPIKPSYFEYEYMKHVQYPYKDRIEAGIQPIVISLERIASRGLVALFWVGLTYSVHPFIQETHEHQTDGQAMSHHKANVVLHLATPKGGSCWEINKNPAAFPQQKYLREMSVALFFLCKTAG